MWGMLGRGVGAGVGRGVGVGLSAARSGSACDSTAKATNDPTAEGKVMPHFVKTHGKSQGETQAQWLSMGTCLAAHPSFTRFAWKRRYSAGVRNFGPMGSFNSCSNSARAT